MQPRLQSKYKDSLLVLSSISNQHIKSVDKVAEKDFQVDVALDQHHGVVEQGQCLAGKALAASRGVIGEDACFGRGDPGDTVHALLEHENLAQGLGRVAAESLGALPRRQGCQLLADILRGQQIARQERLHRGAQVALASRADAVDGFQAGLVNVCLDLDASPRAGEMRGAQIGLVNVCDSGAGLQLGLWNQARTFAGVQIGLCNVISEGPVPFLPIVNASF